MSTDRKEKLITIVALALLGAFVLQALLSAEQKSPTMDEQNHIARGYAYLRTGDLRLSREHPPLVNTISALPLLIIRPQLPTDHPSWVSANWYAFADKLLWHATDADGQPIEAQKIVNWARVTIVLLGLFLGIGVYAWAAELHGSVAGLLALALYVFSPNILAHTSLATNDLGLACFIFLALYTFWRFMTGPTVIGMFVTGVALGLALAAKFSAVILLPIFALLVMIHAWRRPLGPTRPPWWHALEWEWALYLVAMVVIGLAVVWGIYGLERGPLSDGGVTLPMPSYWNGLRAIFERTEEGNPAFLMGQYSVKGWWYYFPVILLIKTPLPVLLLLLLTLALSIRRRSRRTEMCLLLPVAVYFLALMGSSLNIGYRHLLPILPLLFVYISKVASDNARFSMLKYKWADGATQFMIRSGLTVIVIGLVAWQALSALRIYPHYLAYFNEVAGGPENGYRYVVDSNLDWGQDLPALGDYLNQEGIDQVYLSWFGVARPERYGIRYRPLPGFPLYQYSAEAFAYNPYQPAPGLYAISATNLQGVFFKDNDTFAWFRDQESLARPGHSIFIYRVPEHRDLPRTK
ncbi:MAG: phospholipid carrier-dependent glycosyltransferase [Candidatus Sedimenticola sp. (ex Thyasira tokunagai)]